MLTSSCDFRSIRDSKTVGTSSLKVQARWGVGLQQTGRRASLWGKGAKRRKLREAERPPGGSTAPVWLPTSLLSRDHGGTSLALNPSPATVGPQKHHRRLYIISPHCP